MPFPGGICDKKPRYCLAFFVRVNPISSLELLLEDYQSQDPELQKVILKRREVRRSWQKL